MSRNVFSAVLFFLLLASMLASAFNIQRVKATLGTVYIRADGSIYPPEAPISTIDNVTYTLTGNIITDSVSDSMHIERDNIVLDGPGFLVDGSASDVPSWVILVHKRSNVTIQNISIKGKNAIRLQDGTSNVTVQNASIESFGEAGIWNSWSSNNTIIGNTVTSSGYYGIYLDHADSNIVAGNTVTRSWVGVNIYHSYNNNITENIIANGTIGIGLYWTSSGNRLEGNIIANNVYGISLDDSSNYNSISGNTLTYNGLYVWDSYPNIVENNTVNGRPLVYMEDVVDHSVADAGQVVLVRCARIRVENLSLSGTSIGIELWQTDDSIISANNVTANSNGILLYSSSNSSIIGNDITNNSGGITFYYSSNSSISGNNITANSFGILLYSSSNNAILGNNIINNSDGILLKRYSSTGSANNCISGNNITNNHSSGISLYYSSDNSISGNNLASNNYGIFAENWSSYNSVTANALTGNGDGIVLRNYCDNNDVVGNNMTANITHGILLDDSFDNRFCHNNIINNSQQATISPSGYANVWDDGYPLGGNYWSDHSGTDIHSGPYQNETGSDGVGDVPYVIDGNNQDRFPLVNVGTLVRGDVNYDGIVDIFDAIILAGTFNSVPGNADWNPNADMNKDYTVDIFDAILLASDFGKSWRASYAN